MASYVAAKMSGLQGYRSSAGIIGVCLPGAGCIDCGYNAHPAALDIDHMEGKTANISSLKSISSVEAEIARHKCVVRCATCHRIKSWETRTWERHDSSTGS